MLMMRAHGLANRLGSKAWVNLCADNTFFLESARPVVSIAVQPGALVGTAVVVDQNLD